MYPWTDSGIEFKAGVYYQDAAHGWLAVEAKELAMLGIAGQISTYSYVARETGLVFLEEDCDMARYMRAKPDFKPSREVYTERSRIRGMERYGD